MGKLKIYSDQRFLAHGFWAVADQGAISLGNFASNIILARILIPQQYGAYAILTGILLFLYGLHGALVTYPLSLRGAPAPKQGLQVLAEFSLWLTGAVGIVLGVAVFLACWAFGRPMLGFSAAAALIFWMFQETLRRALMSHMRYFEALWGDILSYAGQAALLFFLGLHGWLSPEIAFLVMAATSLIAAGIQATQLGISFHQVRGRQELCSTFWNLGRWMMINNITAVFSVQFFPWMLAVLIGAAAAGTFQALTNVLGVTNPIVFSAVSLILPASAKAWRESGSQAASRVAFRYGGLVGLILCPFFAVAMLLPEHMLSMFYGHGSSYVAYGTALRILVLAMAANYMAVVLSTLVNALEQSRVTFVVLGVSAVSSFFIGLPLMAWKGLAGAATAMVIGGVIRAGMLSVVVGRSDFNVAEAGNL